MNLILLNSLHGYVGSKIKGGQVVKKLYIKKSKDGERSEVVIFYKE